VPLFEARVSERQAQSFSPSLDSLLFDLRMASIITIMKLGRDSESIASYRTFHNQARASERAMSNSNRLRRKQISPSAFTRSFVRESNLEVIERRFSRGIVAWRN